MSSYLDFLMALETVKNAIEPWNYIFLNRDKISVFTGNIKVDHCNIHKLGVDRYQTSCVKLVSQVNEIIVANHDDF